MNTTGLPLNFFSSSRTSRGYGGSAEYDRINIDSCLHIRVGQFCIPEFSERSSAGELEPEYKWPFSLQRQFPLHL